MELTAKLITEKVTEAISVSDRMKILNWKYTGTLTDIKVGSVLKSVRIDKASSNGRLNCSIGYWTGWGVSKSNEISAGNPELWNIQVVSVDNSKKTFEFKLVQLDFKLENK
jgi:hypothetical protein